MKHLIYCIFLFIISTGYSQDAFDVCPIKNSQPVPETTVFTIDGSSINLKNYINGKSVIVVFYRGGWCPYCMNHLSALQEVKSEIDELGYELIAITPDDFSKLNLSISNSKGFDYTLFSDKNVSAINAFGIGWKMENNTYEKYKSKWNIDLEAWSGEKHHILPVPSIFIIKEGKIKFQHVDPDYSKRLSAKTLLSLL